MKTWLVTALSIGIGCLLSAAEFYGGSQIEIADSSGGLNWVPANNAHTLSCWFKLSLPSNDTLTESMLIEFCIWQEAVDPALLSLLMFENMNTFSFVGLVGYYKLGARNSLVNTAQSPPAGTTPATTVGTVTFPNANVGGEQSTFDAYKNGGRDAVASLGGGFTWQQLAFSTL